MGGPGQLGPGTRGATAGANPTIDHAVELQPRNPELRDAASRASAGVVGLRGAGASSPSSRRPGTAPRRCCRACRRQPEVGDRRRRSGEQFGQSLSWTGSWRYDVRCLLLFCGMRDRLDSTRLTPGTGTTGRGFFLCRTATGPSGPGRSITPTRGLPDPAGDVVRIEDDTSGLDGNGAPPRVSRAPVDNRVPGRPAGTRGLGFATDLDNEAEGDPAGDARPASHDSCPRNTHSARACSGIDCFLNSTR